MKIVNRVVTRVAPAALIVAALAGGERTNAAEQGAPTGASEQAAAAQAVASPGPSEIVEMQLEARGVLRGIAELPVGVAGAGPRMVPLYRPGTAAPGGLATLPDSVLQPPSGATAVSVDAEFEGLGDGFPGFTELYSPPDTNGAAGPTQYVQWVNVNFEVFDKSGNAIAGPYTGSTLWSGLGGPCATSDGGDPIVQYDALRGRWVMMQMQYPGFGSKSNGHYLCLAVSSGSDFLSSSFDLFAYKFKQLTDYPKLAVWSDGYYITFNGFNGFGSFAGPVVCAFDPGTPTLQCSSLSRAYASLLPADVDDATQAPSGGEPEYLLALGNDSKSLLAWRFHVDWGNARRSSLTGPYYLDVAPYNEACGGGTCVPQPETTQELDSLGDRLMYRLAYRNFGSYESLVVNHSVQAYQDGATGLRWYELTNTPSSAATAPTVYQQATYAPTDGPYRWMGSVAMDHAGNLALGYSFSGANDAPYLAVASRCGGDPAGVLREELALSPAYPLASQTSTDRWGDYASMSPDPSDPSVLWFTTEYMADGSSWRTRIAKLRLGCPSP